MDDFLGEKLARLTFGPPQSWKGLQVFPILSDGVECMSYVTLQEALDGGKLLITELPGGGSVPNLKAVNKGDEAVLLLDGEELVGAKQNRVLNTTILLAGHSETTIPVSCTERGRWHEVSPSFRHSDVVAFLRLRAEQADKVRESLERGSGYHGNQQRVWAVVDEVASFVRVHSQTSAMRDVFKGTKTKLEDYLSRFPLVQDQVGLLVLLDRQVLGLDVVSRRAAYSKLHRKLLTSYAMEAIVHPPAASETKVNRDAVESFLKACRDSSCKRFESVGLGFDYRCRGVGVVGTALAVQECVVHLAFFSVNHSPERETRISSFADRLGNRVDGV